MFHDFVIPVPTNAIFDPVDIMGNVSSDIGLISHKNDIVQIVQEIDNIVNAVFRRVDGVRVAKRFIIEEDEVVECVFESFVIGPDFAGGRLGFVVENDCVDRHD